MKNLFKKIVLVSCLLTLTLTMTACAKKQEPLAIPDNAAQIASSLITGVNKMSDENISAMEEEETSDIEDFFDQYGYSVDGAAFISGLDSWQSAKDEMGGITEISDPVMTSDSKEITATFALKGNKRNADCVVVMDKKCNITSITVNAKYSTGEKLGQAGLTTVLGMGMTFVILIFLCFIISLMAYIPKIQASFGKKKETPAKETAAAVDNTISQIIEKEELKDDSELVAVITAAVAAYEAANGNTSISGDGFVVRSIRRHF